MSKLLKHYVAWPDLLIDIIIHLNPDYNKIKCWGNIVIKGLRLRCILFLDRKIFWFLWHLSTGIHLGFHGLYWKLENSNSFDYQKWMIICGALKLDHETQSVFVEQSVHEDQRAPESCRVSECAQAQPSSFFRRMKDLL